MKKTGMKNPFVLPLVPTLIIIVAATALLVYVFHVGVKGPLEYIAYLFSTYSLVLACTGYARLIRKDRRWAAPFLIPMIPTMIVIIVGAALEIYVFTAQNFGPIAYVAYLVSAYALVLAIVGYVRLFRQLSRSRKNVYLNSRRGTVSVQSRFLNGLMSTFLAPFVEAVLTYFSYTMVKTAKGILSGSIMPILLAIFSIIGILLLAISGPLFFLVGICCIYLWSRFTRGIILCAIGLIAMVFASMLSLRIMEKQQQEIAGDLRSL